MRNSLSPKSELSIPIDHLSPISQGLEEEHPTLARQVELLELWGHAVRPETPDFIAAELETIVEQYIELLDEGQQRELEYLLALTNGDTETAIKYLIWQARSQNWGQGAAQENVIEEVEVQTQPDVITPKDTFTEITRLIERDLSESEIEALKALSEASDEGIKINDIRRIVGSKPSKQLQALIQKGVITYEGNRWNVVYKINPKYKHIFLGEASEPGVKQEVTEEQMDKREETSTEELDEVDQEMLRFIVDKRGVGTTDIIEHRKQAGLACSQGARSYINHLIDKGYVLVEKDGRTVTYIVTKQGRKILRELESKEGSTIYQVEEVTKVHKSVYNPGTKTVGVAEIMPSLPDRSFWVYVYPRLYKLIAAIPNTLEQHNMQDYVKQIPITLDELRNLISFNGHKLNGRTCGQQLKWILTDTEYRISAIEPQIAARTQNGQMEALALIQIFAALIEQEDTLNYLEDLFEAKTEEELQIILQLIEEEDKKKAKAVKPKKSRPQKSQDRVVEKAPTRELITQEQAEMLLEKFQENIDREDIVPREELFEHVAQLMVFYNGEDRDVEELAFVIAEMVRNTLIKSKAKLIKMRGVWSVTINDQQEYAMGGFSGKNQNSNIKSRSIKNSGNKDLIMDPQYFFEWFNHVAKTKRVGIADKRIRALARVVARIFNEDLSEEGTEM